MTDGLSWSGRERNNCLVNLGDGTFADASYAAGLDFIDDGRAVAAVDWDGDGDLDLWLKNRTGPQLRFLRNDHEGSEHFVAFKLRGTTANRDAIGATVELLAGGKRRVRSVVAGDGYLAQSSTWLHFGLGAVERIDKAVVRWPGGEAEELHDLTVDRRYIVAQHGGQPQVAAPRTSTLRVGPLPSSVPSGSSAVLLKQPLPLPPTLTDRIDFSDDPAQVYLLNFWAQWCEPCIAELGQMAKRGDQLEQQRIDLITLSVDAPGDRTRATEVLGGIFDGASSFPASHVVGPDELTTVDAILRHVLGRHDELKLPTSLLVDASGRLQVVYVGTLDPDRLIADTNEFVRGSMKLARRSRYAGRWYYRTPRNIDGLAQALKDEGRNEDALFFFLLAQQSAAGG